MIIFATLTAMAQRPTGILTGHVLDTSGKPVIGAMIRIVGTTQGGVSKAPDGKFTVSNLDTGSRMVKITGVGYSPAEYPVTITANTAIKIAAEIHLSQYEPEVIIISCPALVIRRERFGTTSTISAEELDQMP